MDDIQISEKKLEDFVCEHLSGKDHYEGFEDLGAEPCNFVFRQFDLAAYGIADIITFDIDYDGGLETTIYELKQNKINSDALVQVFRYKQGIKQILESLSIESNIYCILIGCGIDHANGLDVALSSIENLSVYSYDICPKTGVVLKFQNFTYLDTRIPKSTTKKLTCVDYSITEQSKTFFERLNSEGV